MFSILQQSSRRIFEVEEIYLLPMASYEDQWREVEKAKLILFDQQNSGTALNVDDEQNFQSHFQRICSDSNKLNVTTLMSKLLRSWHHMKSFRDFLDRIRADVDNPSRLLWRGSFAIIQVCNRYNPDLYITLTVI